MNKQKVKCLFGFHKYDEQHNLYPMYDDVTGMPPSSDWKYTQVRVCSGCRLSLRFIDCTLFGCHLCDILEETNDQFTVSVFGSKYPFSLRKS